jgi:hypothetical protein
VARPVSRWFPSLAEGTASRAPPYEVSFYVQLGDSNARKMCVVYYCPNPSTERGSIYLPGKGEVWQSLNWGSMMRPGRDGKWNYASRAWEDLIKPVIARADAAQHHGS